MQSTIASMTDASVRKCWPKRLRAMCFIGRPPSAALAGRRRALMRRLAQLDVGAGAQLVEPLGVGRLELPLAQHVARLLALLARVELDLAALDDLDQVHAEARDDRLGDAADRQRVHRLLELGHQAAGRSPAQVAAGRRAAVLGVLARQLLERRLAGGSICCLELGQPADRRLVAQLRRRPQQDVARARLRDREGCRRRAARSASGRGSRRRCAAARARPRPAAGPCTPGDEDIGQAIGRAQADHAAVGLVAVLGDFARDRLEGLAGAHPRQRGFGAVAPLGHRRSGRALGHRDQDLRDVELRRVARPAARWRAISASISASVIWIRDCTSRSRSRSTRIWSRRLLRKRP